MTGGGTSLEFTATWAVAALYVVIISVSIVLEHSIHLFMNWLKRRHRTVLYDAVAKLKSELMLLGVLSLLLTATQRPISRICIPTEVANKMLPCGRDITHKSLTSYGHWINYNGTSSTRRLGDDHEPPINATDPCTSKGKVSLITAKGAEQLQQFIFVLAATQILYSVFTVALGRVKMKRWKAWEKETETTDYENSNAPNKLARQTTFGRRHTQCTETTIQLWIKCFFRQFFSSVAKTDYLTLRHGFIMAHLSAKQLNSFNFQKYIKHSLDGDFKVVISISPIMWLTVVIFMLVDIHGWHSYFWISFAPLLIVLIVGTKLEVIVAKMALQLKKQKNVMTTGAPLVELNDNHFWFGQPTFLLDLLHLTLFLNAFEIAFFVWVSMEFGSDSCYHERTTKVTRVVLAVSVQVICSYITLPLYALVTQMGSQFRGEIFNEKIAQVLKQWHTQVKRDRRKKQESSVKANEKGLNNDLSNSPAESSYRSKKLSEITEEFGMS